MKTYILVTGGAGFIGSYLVERLLKNENYYVVVADNLSTGVREKMPPSSTPQFKFINCDVNDYQSIASVMQAYRFDYVFHYAAMVGVQRTQQHPLQVLEDITGISNICKLSRVTGVKRLFFSSSSEVYGEPFEIPQRVDTTPLNSRVPYAVVKNVGESFLRSYYQEYGLEYSIFRFFNTYGPRQSLDFVMSKFIIKAMKNEDITIYGDGTQTRTFCYIDDNVDACVNAFENNLLINGVANIGGDKEIMIKDLADIIVKKTNSSSKIINVPPLKDGDMKRRCPDNDFMKTKLLGRPLTTLEEGIDKMLAEGLFDMKR
ncbi:MAG: NAD-dependent epimerase/dehydratase family protein [Bacteroidales bacterium]|jgi:UDP-glucose 4-epimerase|nr:NAD-dependent epimerase/dehydratase family protein [Bacteroidales bacterium]MBP5724273.1 NAD-dependent epimerase/dehydratase family protein [Bacteroidales bacterium]MBQ4215033.1 NAD-dependent epimerase/dehydratase family protein [Bacteroidales bacterium]MBR4497332.1 NAD-dependent epimerase/dehydratase family protein [Bacteroidales bacterium]